MTSLTAIFDVKQGKSARVGLRAEQHESQPMKAFHSRTLIKDGGPQYMGFIIRHDASISAVKM